MVALAATLAFVSCSNGDDDSSPSVEDQAMALYEEIYAYREVEDASAYNTVVRTAQTAIDKAMGAWADEDNPTQNELSLLKSMAEKYLANIKAEYNKLDDAKKAQALPKDK